MFINFIISGVFFYLSKVKKIHIDEAVEIKNENEFKISFGGDEKNPGGIYAGRDIIIGKYKVSDIVNTINSFTKSFNETNKWVNIASGIVTLIAGITCLVSILIIK